MNTDDTATGTDGTPWLSTSKAAAALGVSERTIQRRAAKGKVEARKVTGDDGEKWEVLLEVPEVPPTVTTGAAIVTPQVPTGDDTHNERESVQVPPQIGDSVGTVPTGDDTVPPHQTRPEMEAELRAQLEREREQVMFLRGLVEQRDRDAAELRAALREALRAMPKQLSAGDASAMPQTALTAPQDAPRRDLTANDSPGAEIGRESPSTRRGDGLSMLRDGLKKMFGKGD